MARIGTIPIDGSVVVEPHAADQARERFKSYKGRTRADVSAEIAAEVRDCIERGLVYDVRPRGFYVTERSRHGGGGKMQLGQRFVLARSGEKGWVVTLISRTTGDITVVTTLRRIAVMHS